MRLFTALKKNIVPILFVVVVVGLLIYMTQRKEGFATCNATNCRGVRYNWFNNKCYKCPSNKVFNTTRRRCEMKLRPGEKIGSNPSSAVIVSSC
jgi:hypothetical protein